MTAASELTRIAEVADRAIEEVKFSLCDGDELFDTLTGELGYTTRDERLRIFLQRIQREIDRAHTAEMERISKAADSVLEEVKVSSCLGNELFQTLTHELGYDTRDERLRMFLGKVQRAMEPARPTGERKQKGPRAGDAEAHDASAGE